MSLDRIEALKKVSLSTFGPAGGAFEHPAPGGNRSVVVSEAKVQESEAAEAASAIALLAALFLSSPQGKRAPRSRYVARKEPFGCILYDRVARTYIPFDAEATAIFAGESEPQDGFLESCRRLEILEPDGSFRHPWIRTECPGPHLSAPLKLSFNVTNNCNLRCRHCHTSSLDGDPELGVGDIKHLLDQMAELGVFLLSVAGGEPFYHPEFLEALEHAGNLGIDVTLISNGTLIDEALAVRLDGLPVYYICISVDGADAQTHDRVRGKGSFEQALTAVRNLKQHFGRPLYLYSTLNRHNVSQIPDFFSLAESLHCDGLRFRPTLPLGRATKNMDLMLSADEFLAAQALIKQLAAKSPLHIDDPETEDYTSDWYSNFGCVAGNTYAHIGFQGNLYPCHYMDTAEFNTGNLLTSSLKSLWDNGQVFRRFRTLKGNSACNGCDRLSACKGGCRARALLVTRDLEAPDPWCGCPASF